MGVYFGNDRRRASNKAHQSSQSVARLRSDESSLALSHSLASQYQFSGMLICLIIPVIRCWDGLELAC